MSSSGGLFGSSPATRSNSGISTNTKNGPKYHQTCHSVAATSPQIIMGISGMTAPMIQR